MRVWRGGGGAAKVIDEYIEKGLNMRYSGGKNMRISKREIREG